MRKALSYLCLSGLLMPALAQPEIPNHSFETWDIYDGWTLEPLNWETPNFQLMESVVQDSNAYSGDLAMRVNVLPGFEGGVPQTASTRLAIDDLPEALQFAVKANVPDGDEMDRVTVSIEFRNDGASVMTEEWTSYESIAGWQMALLPLNGGGTAVDSAIISVTAGYTNGLGGGSWDTWISVDSMFFTPDLAIDKIETGHVRIYPNPCDDWLFITPGRTMDPRAAVSVHDSMGRLILSSPISTRLDVARLAPGVYSLSFISDEKLLQQEKFIKQ